MSWKSANAVPVFYEVREGRRRACLCTVHDMHSAVDETIESQRCVLLQ